MIHGQARQILYFLVKTGNNQGKEELYMAEIIHRYVNGTEISFHDLPSYQITNQTILDIPDAAGMGMIARFTTGKRLLWPRNRAV